MLCPVLSGHRPDLLSAAHRALCGFVLSKSNPMSCTMKGVFLHLCVFCIVHGDHSWCIKGPLPHLQNTHLKASVLKKKQKNLEGLCAGTAGLLFSPPRGILIEIPKLNSEMEE